MKNNIDLILVNDADGQRNCVCKLCKNLKKTIEIKKREKKHKITSIY